MAVSSEITALYDAIGDWLTGITGMSALIGTRCYNGWPSSPPSFPMVTYGITRSREGDYPGSPWRCVVEIRVHAVTRSDADKVEDLITNWIEDGDNSLPSSWSKTDLVVCIDAAPATVGADEFNLSQEDGRMLFLTRPLSFNALVRPDVANVP